MTKRPGFVGSAAPAILSWKSDRKGPGRQSDVGVYPIDLPFSLFFFAQPIAPGISYFKSVLTSVHVGSLSLCLIPPQGLSLFLLPSHNPLLLYETLHVSLFKFLRTYTRPAHISMPDQFGGTVLLKDWLPCDTEPVFRSCPGRPEASPSARPCEPGDVTVDTEPGPEL